MYDKLDEISLGFAEPATSFIARLAAHYGLASAREFAGDFGLSFDDIASGRRTELVKLADLTGCDINQLLANTPSTGEQAGRLKVGNEAIAASFSRRRHLFVCPECWAEDVARYPDDLPEASAYVRLHWLFRPITTCDTHSRPLVMVKAATNNWTMYDTALMAGNIAVELPTMLAQTGRRTASGFEKYTSARLYGQPASAGLLDHLALNEVFSLCAHIGRAVDLRTTRLVDMSEDDLHNAYDLGFRTLSAGREGIREAMFNVLQHRGHMLPPTVGPQNLIGKAYAVLIADHVGQRRYAPVYEDIANAVYDVMPWGPADNPLFGIPITHRRFYSAASAAKVFHIAARTMDTYSVRAGIATVFGSSTGRRRILIDAQAAHEIFDPAGHIAERQLARFGITLIQRRAIMDVGLLKTVLPRDLFPANERPPIRITDVENLMAKFVANAELVNSVPDGCATLRHVARAIQGRLADVHQFILEGKIWTGRLKSEPRIYASLLVRPDEVRSLLDAGRLLSTREMSVASGLSKELLVAMSSTGTIPHIVERNAATGKIRRSYTSETADWARRELVPLTQVARRFGLQGKSLRKRLDKLGLVPFCTVPIARGCLSVYLASEVNDLTL